MMVHLIAMLALAAGPAVTTVARGPMSAITESKEVVARSSTDWTALWKEHAAPQPAPAVNFSTDMVAAVFLGSRPTGGFSVEIVGTRSEGDVLIIEYAERRPGRGDIVSQVLTAPFHIVKLPTHNGSVRFQKR
jgi:hypothetical protein